MKFVTRQRCYRLHLHRRKSGTTETCAVTLNNKFKPLFELRYVVHCMGNLREQKSRASMFEFQTRRMDTGSMLEIECNSGVMTYVTNRP